MKLEMGSIHRCRSSMCSPRQGMASSLPHHKRICLLGISKMRDSRYAYLHPYLTLHHILYQRICWSSTRGYADSVLGYRRGINRGEWAKHCFDIVTREDHIVEEKDYEEWRDVSEEAVAFVARIWNTTTIGWPRYGRKYGRTQFTARDCVKACPR